MIYDALKRTLDILGAVVGLAVTAPLTLPVMALLHCQNDGQVFFEQDRIGRDGKTFKVKKFKTMTDARDPQTGELLPDNQRVTKLGHFLRKRGIDELPQLFNILDGEMSLLGPRPLTPDDLYVPPDIAGQVAWLDDRMEKRNQLTPGLISRAAVTINPKSADWEKRFDDDVVSVRCPSLLRDMATVFMAAKVVIVGRHNASDNCANGHKLREYLANKIETQPYYRPKPVYAEVEI